MVLGVFITEVEKQLQGGGEIPLLSYKKSQTGSTGNIHGLVLVSEQLSSAGITQGNISFTSPFCLIFYNYYVYLIVYNLCSKIFYLMNGIYFRRSQCGHQAEHVHGWFIK